MTDDLTVYAHRGFAGRFPENTVRAAVRAVRAGAVALEVDVMPTADGDVVVFHDRRLDAGPESRGITDARGYVWERSTDVVTNARVRGDEATVPLLSTLLGAIPSDVLVSVELKNPGTAELFPDQAFDSPAAIPNRDRWRSFVGEVVDLCADAPNPIEYSSFCEGGLRAVTELDPDADLAVPFWRDVDAGRELARRYDPDAVHVPLSMLAGTPLFDAETHDRSAFGDPGDVVSWAETIDADVAAYTVQTWWEARAVAEADCDGFFADYPDLLQVE
ncbi:MAG: glycerophosphodiester phosphodiesterase [Haloarculaceae archaeon]